MKWKPGAAAFGLKGLRVLTCFTPSPFQPEGNILTKLRTWTFVLAKEGSIGFAQSPHFLGRQPFVDSY
jgi:hypothetical protein